MADSKPSNGPTGGKVGVTSVVLLTVDRLAFLKRCVESIVQHTKDPSLLEWVFVLNGASSEVSTYLTDFAAQHAERYSGVVLVPLQKNEGVTPGRNVGIEMSQGEFVLFLDDDAWVSEEPAYLQPEDREIDWLRRMTKWFVDPLTGVVGQTGSYINPSTPGMFWGCSKHGAECDVMQGYCFMFRRSLVPQIGSLDPYFGRFWHEESEYALRVRAAGYRVVNLGYIGVTHYGSGSGDDGTYGAKIAYMFQKWQHRFSEILVPREKWVTL